MMAGLTIDNPVKLWKGLRSSNIIPGDTLRLRAGTYSAGAVNDIFTVAFQAGTAELPITIRPYQNERVIIDGAITSLRDNVILRDLEFDYSGWPDTRHTDEQGSDPVLFEPERNVGLAGANVKLINCVIHNLYNGVGWMAAGAGEISGCVIYNCGWAAPERGHGHAMYLQNTAAAQKVIRGNIIFQQFSTGIKAYTEGGNCDNFLFEGNTCFNNGILWQLGPEAGLVQNAWNLWAGAYVPATTHTFQNNWTYHDPAYSDGDRIQIGLGQEFLDIHLVNNYFQEGIYVYAGAVVVEESGNYYGSKTLATTGNQVFVRANDYQTDRANVTIYNQAQANSVTADLTAVTGLQAGDTVQVRNVQDYFVDIQTLTLDANKQITIDMQAANRTVETPRFWDATATTFPAFGCFVVHK